MQFTWWDVNFFWPYKFNDFKFLICQSHSHFFQQKLLLFLSFAPLPLFLYFFAVVLRGLFLFSVFPNRNFFLLQFISPCSFFIFWDSFLHTTKVSVKCMILTIWCGCTLTIYFTERLSDVIFVLHFTFLIMVQISENSPVLAEKQMPYRDNHQPPLSKFEIFLILIFTWTRLQISGYRN